MIQRKLYTMSSRHIVGQCTLLVAVAVVGNLRALVAGDLVRTKLLIDCDPGVDDVMALMWAVAAARRHPERMEIVAVTTVSGNSAARLVFGNAAAALGALGAHDVVVGRSEDPNMDEGSGAVETDNFFGEDGMGGLGKMWNDEAKRRRGGKIAVRFEAAPRSVDVIRDMIAEHGSQLVILAMGPVTNLAKVAAADPSSMASPQIIIMGGSLDLDGNVAPLSEFNTWFDPAALATVLDTAHAAQNSNVVLLPLDVTERICWTDMVSKRILEASPAGSILANLMVSSYEAQSKNDLEFGEPCFHPHDSITVAFLIHPHLFSFRRLRVHIVKPAVGGADDSLRGMIWADRRLGHAVGEGWSPNAWVADAVDADMLLLAMARDVAWLANEDKEVRGGAGRSVPESPKASERGRLYADSVRTEL